MGVVTILRRRISEFVLAGLAFAAVQVPTPALAQRSGALGSGGIGLVGRSQGGLFTQPGYFSFDRYSLGSDAFLNRRHPRPSGPLRANPQGPLSTDVSGGRRLFGAGSPAYYVSPLVNPGLPGMAANRNRAPITAPFGRGATGAAVPNRSATAFGSRSAGVLSPYGRRGAVSTPMPFGGPVLAAPDRRPVRRATPPFDPTALTPTDAEHEAYEVIGGVGRSRLRELQDTLDPAAQVGANEERPFGQDVDIVDSLAMERRARGHLHLRQGWAHFRAGAMQQAWSSFQRAEEVRLDTSEAIRGSLYSALAIERYAVAGALLVRLLRDDPQALSRPGDLRERYADPADYQAQVARLRTQVEVVQPPPRMLALYAYVLWQDGQPIEARPYARRAAASVPTGPFGFMLARMLQLESASAGAADGGPPSP